MLETISTMFRRIMLNLTMLNSTVILLVFIIYSSVIYFYIADNLFDTIDNAMVRAITDFGDNNKGFFPSNRTLHLQNGKGKMIHSEEQRRKPPPLVDLRILVVAEDVDGRILLPEPNEKIDLEDVKKLITDIPDKIPQSIMLNDHEYRILSISYPKGDYPTVRVGKEKIIEVKKISAVTVVDSEVSMLKRLVLIIMIGTIIGFFVIIGVAYYLARRALVPIKVSWDKQQQFVTDASHELRTPIAVIKTNTELLLHNPDHTIEEESIRIATILKESTRMGKLVATLLTLARADSNQIEIERTRVDLSDILKELAEQFEPIAEMKGIKIQVALEPHMEIIGDKERIHQLFVILMDNAIRYTLQEGKIVVVGKVQHGAVHISMQDTGIGISAENLPLIFERFYRGDKSRSRDDGGSGLGLSIAKWIIEKHGGRIQVESAIGEGSQFHIYLPLEKKVFSA